MRNLALFIVAFLVGGLLFAATTARAQFEGEVWHERFGQWLEPIWPEGRDILILGIDRYVNFGFDSGSSGYGIRDNGGLMEFKDSGGAWAGFGTGSGSGGISTSSVYTIIGQQATWAYVSSGDYLKPATSTSGIIVQGASSTITGALNFGTATGTSATTTNLAAARFMIGGSQYTSLDGDGLQNNSGVLEFLCNDIIGSGISCAGNNITASLGSSISVGEMTATDFGDWTCNGSSCTLDSDTVSDSEIDYSTVTLADFTNDAGFITGLTGSTGQVAYFSGTDTAVGTSSILLTGDRVTLFETGSGDKDFFVGDPTFANPVFQVDLRRSNNDVYLYMQGTGGTSWFDVNVGDNAAYMDLSDAGTGWYMQMNDQSGADAGEISFKHSSANTAGALDFSAITTSAKRFTFPNNSGVVAVATSTLQVSSINSTSTDTSIFRGLVNMGAGATTTTFFANGLVTCNTGNMLTWSGGVFGCEDDSTGAGGGAWPWSLGTNYNTAVNSTSTPTWFTNGFHASGTSHMVNASTSQITVQDIFAPNVTNGSVYINAPTGSIEGAAEDVAFYHTSSFSIHDLISGGDAFLDLSTITGNNSYTFFDQSGKLCLVGVACDGAFSTTSAIYFSEQGLAFSTTSSDFWETTQLSRDADDITDNNIYDLVDVDDLTGVTLGDLLYWNGSLWTDIATSSLGLEFSTTSANYYESTLATRGASTTLFTDTNTFGGPNTFTGHTTLGSASSTIFSAFTQAAFGSSATSTFDASGNLTLSSGSTFSFNLARGSNGSASSPTYSFTNDSNTGFYGSTNGDRIQVVTGGAENSRFTSVGLGVGTTSFTSRFTVGGNSFLGGNVIATGTLSLTGTTNGVLVADTAGLVSASSTLGLDRIPTCIEITGSADLCDGGDATGGGGGAWPWDLGTNFNVAVNSTSTPTWYTAGMHASGTSQIAYASSTAMSAVTGFFTSLFIGADTLAEYISDTVGAMFSGNTETGIAITYDDADNTIDAVCATASGSTFGCLLAADWTRHEGKVSTTSIDTLAELETLWGSINVIQSTEIDTLAELETIMSSINILAETEVDGCSELVSLYDNETGGCNGTSGPVFPDGPTFTGTLTFANITGTNATTTTLFSSFSSTTKAMFITSSTSQATIFSLVTPNITSAVLVAGSGGVAAAASAQTCTNQFVRAMSAAYVATCATVQSEDINLSDAFAWAGNQDFGGASFLEIPNGTAPTANDVGEIAHDTTDSTNPQLILDDYVVGKGVVKLWGRTVASSSVDFVSGGRIPFPMLPDGVTITELHCFVDGGTSVVLNLDTLAGGVNTDTITCDADGASDTTISSNPTMAALTLPVLEFGTVTGSVDYVSISVYGTITRE